MTWNVAVVKRWIELATIEDISEAIDILSPAGTALCMAASLKKDHESGRKLGCNFQACVFNAFIGFQNKSICFSLINIFKFDIYFLLNHAEGRELVRILLAAGADPTAKDIPLSQTALHTAAMANDVELVRVG